MSLEKIIEKITGDVKAKAECIKNEALVSKERIILEAEEEGASRKKTILADAEKKGAQERRRIETSLRLDSKKALLLERQLMLDMAFEKAKEHLLGLDDEAYRELIKGMILNALERGDEEIIVSNEDKRRLGLGFLKELNAELAKEGKLGQLRLSEDKDSEIEGGFVLKGKDIEIDGSLTTIIETMRPELQMEVAKVLFEDFPVPKFPSKKAGENENKG